MKVGGQYLRNVTDLLSDGKTPYERRFGQPFKKADYSFLVHLYSSYVLVLEDKIQDRGLYLFTISYGSNAVDQRSGVG